MVYDTLGIQAADVERRFSVVGGDEGRSDSVPGLPRGPQDRPQDLGTWSISVHVSEYKEVMGRLY